MATCSKSVEAQGHHVQGEFCTTRAAYRQGKELKAVKVYTINDESQHLLIQNVPSIGLTEEVKRLAGRFGKTEKVELLSDYAIKQEFTHVYYVKYLLLRDARLAKKKLDNRSFFGSILHVCYAPELESVDECRKKLKDRLRSIQKSWPSAASRKPNCKKLPTNNAIKESLTASLTCTKHASSAGAWSDLLPKSSSIIIPIKRGHKKT